MDIHETHVMFGAADSKMCRKCARCTCHDAGQLKEECTGKP
jgi:hypothetical protein